MHAKSTFTHIHTHTQNVIHTIKSAYNEYTTQLAFIIYLNGIYQLCVHETWLQLITLIILIIRFTTCNRIDMRYLLI